MILSRLKPGNAIRRKEDRDRRKKVPELDEFLSIRDYQGALAILEFKEKNGERDGATDLWTGHCLFRSGDYKKALKLYEWMLSQENCPREVHTYAGCCFFFLGMYVEARDAADKAERSALQNRLLFYVAHKLADEKRLLQHHAQLKDSIEDQLCLASLHYLRNHYQQAVDIYKKILSNNKNFIALNVYLALCYYKLDYYDVALEVLQVYLRQYPDSAAALNLKACCIYKLYTGQAAELEIEQLRSHSLYPFARYLITHNSVVFKNGDGALQVLPALIDVIPEARINLVLYYLRRQEIEHALSLVEELEPQQAPEFIIKAITFTHIGQMKGSKEHLKTAELFFKMVGESPADCDTIPGRQSMASSFFLQKQWDEVIIYLNSIKQYFLTDDTFYFNFGQAQLMAGNYVEAEATLLQVQGDDKRKNIYVQALAICYVRNRKPQLAWDLYKRTKSTAEAFALLKTIANGCYKIGDFFYAFLGFDQLEKADPSPEHWHGKRGAAAGLFKQLAHGEATREQMSEVLSLLSQGHHPQVEQIIGVIRRWARENGIHL
ncbi:unnamed protein product, partial [Mesorhabditis belari]|uniref:Intraflagellar transport protein 56 n=1 Tax=Mesorhabditis belari TaxID=2138241 RepID=A0AAF3FG69_9BILA